MSRAVDRAWAWTVAAALFAACSGGGDGGDGGVDPCVLVFDAGSSGTRLYAYEPDGDRYREVAHARNSTGVSYPAENRDCTGGDGEPCTVAEVVSAVDGLVASVGDACDAYDPVSFYATAGMRLAEQGNRSGADETWGALRAYLDAAFPTARTSAYTLSGYEEGFYTWLTVNALADEEHGTIEVGGASMQVAFACDGCPDAREVVLPAPVAATLGSPTRRVFARSYLGLGRNDARRHFDPGNLCEPGPGTTAAGCAAVLDDLSSGDGILDPDNYVPRNGAQETYVAVSLPPALPLWGAGELGSFDAASLLAVAEERCPKTVAELDADGVSHPSMACFTPVYLDAVLGAFDLAPEGITTGEETIDDTQVGWTLGAALCDATGCLDHSQDVCRWFPDHRCLRSAP